MDRPVALVLASLSLFLLVFPLTLDKPGLPPNLKADEPAYYMMALSLARDGDLLVAEEDVDRALREFPYLRISNLILMSTDGWRTAHYGKPYVYSLFAAPLAGPFGANGILLLNAILLVAMIWMGTLYLGRWNPSWLAALFSTGFFLLSIGSAYAFWLQPEVFNMASVTAALFLGFPRREGRSGEAERGCLVRALLSGAVLMPAVYAKPMVAAVALPLLWIHLRGRRWRRAVAWLGGAVVAMGLIAGLSALLTGTPTAYLGVERQGVTICQPGTLPWDVPDAGALSTAVERSPTAGAWSWVFRVPDVEWWELRSNLGYFLWGRHTGLLLYTPFAALAVALFLLHARGSVHRWLLLAALTAVALFFLLVIPSNWQGGGGFVGNRYFVNVYPAFLFLATRIRPRALVLAGYALGGLFLGPILLTPFGAAVPEPTLQFHTRNAPFRLFPLEQTLREVPGYHRVRIGNVHFIGRKDQVLPRGETLWVRGADRTELWMLSTDPIDEAVFEVRSPAPGNRVRFAVEGVAETVSVGPGADGGTAQRVSLAPEGPTFRGSRTGRSFVGYRLVVRAEDGRSRAYTKRYPPNPCPDEIFGYDRSRQETFFLGAELRFLGPGDALGADVFGIEWEEVEVRRRVRAGQTFYARVRLRNTSQSAWSDAGAAEVRLSYHWLAPVGSVGPDGELETLDRIVEYDGLRTDLPLPIKPGEAVEVLQEIEAPEEPGRYVLALDPVFEHVGWFSRRGVEEHRLEIVVVGPVEETAEG